MRGPRHDHRRREAGQASVLIIGMAAVLVLVVALMVNATAAYIQRQGLNTLADGAALRGADLAATGAEVYEGGVPEGRLDLTAARASRAVAAYLEDVGAYRRYPGLTYRVRVDARKRSVSVLLRAPLDLPLRIPGSPEQAGVGAVGSAVVGVD